MYPYIFDWYRTTSKLFQDYIVSKTKYGGFTKHWYSIGDDSKQLKMDTYALVITCREDGNESPSSFNLLTVTAAAGSTDTGGNAEQNTTTINKNT